MANVFLEVARSRSEGIYERVMGAETVGIVGLNGKTRPFSTPSLTPSFIPSRPSYNTKSNSFALLSAKRMNGVLISLLFLLSIVETESRSLHDQELRFRNGLCTIRHMVL